MRRREFITLLGGAAAAWPLAASAQRPAMPVIGYLSARSPTDVQYLLTAFQQGLSEAGYVEGRNVALEYRFAHNDSNRLPELAADLVSRRVNVIAAVNGIASAIVAKAATSTIPIVFAQGADPVALGLVASLNKPGGNVTGVTFLNNTLMPKLFQWLHELIPDPSIIAMLVNPTNASAEADTKAAYQAADTLGRKLVVVKPAPKASSMRSLEPSCNDGSKPFSLSRTPILTITRSRLPTSRPATHCQRSRQGVSSPRLAAS